MSGREACNCEERKKPAKDRNWRVIDFRCNHSAFNGWKKTHSDYSSFECKSCGAVWRSKADYVYDIWGKK